MITFEKYAQMNAALAKSGGKFSSHDSDLIREFERFFSPAIPHKAFVTYDLKSDRFAVGARSVPTFNYRELAIEKNFLDWSVDQHAEVMRAAAEARQAALSSPAGRAQKVLESLGIAMSAAYALIQSGKVRVEIEDGNFVGRND